MTRDLVSENFKVSVIGLGKLGSCIAATVASKGFNVIGVDVIEEMVNKVNQNQAIQEVFVKDEFHE